MSMGRNHRDLSAPVSALQSDDFLAGTDSECLDGHSRVERGMTL